MRRTTGLIAAWLAFGGAAALHSQSPTPSSPSSLDVGSVAATLPAPTGAPNANFLGARSCSATACHANVSATQVTGGEFIYWLENDPHSQAFDVLRKERSLHMLDRLGIRRDGAIVDRAGYQNCLACHNVTATLSDDNSAALSEGVSCEACHGPARDWKDDHYGPAWQAMSPADKRNLGFHDTDDLSVRARICAQCHVGAADREVNHDLIAAGHPALKFELASYHDLLPKHWSDAHERRHNTRFEGRLWLAGQIEAAGAALELLRLRANRPAWPELAEYDCFTCHHDLVDDSWRQIPSHASTRPGKLSWGTWYYPLLEKVSEAETTGALQSLRAIMEGSVRPDADMVVKATDRALAALDRDATSRQEVGRQAMDKAPPVREELNDMGLAVVVRKSLRDGKPTEHPPGWDLAAQEYLALAAYDAMLRDWRAGQTPKVSAPNVSADLNSIRQLLRFPDPLDSPRTLSAPTLPFADMPRTLQRVVQKLK